MAFLIKREAECEDLENSQLGCVNNKSVIWRGCEGCGWGDGLPT